MVGIDAREDNEDAQKSEVDKKEDVEGESDHITCELSRLSREYEFTNERG